MRHADFMTAPTVVGSHMSLLRPLTPRVSGDRLNVKSGEASISQSGKCGFHFLAYDLLDV